MALELGLIQHRRIHKRCGLWYLQNSEVVVYNIHMVRMDLEDMGRLVVRTAY